MVFRVPRSKCPQEAYNDAAMTRHRDIWSGARATLRRGEPCELFHAPEDADFCSVPSAASDTMLRHAASARAARKQRQGLWTGVAEAVKNYCA